MAIRFTDLTPEGRRYFNELEKLAKLVVKVGFQENSPAYEDDTSLAQVAAYNEFGGSDRPARPFMKQSFENHEDELKKLCDEVNETIRNGGTAESALKKLGNDVKALVQEEIKTGGFAPNAPSTIASKGSAQPLIDTAHMRQSVNFVVEYKG